MRTGRVDVAIIPAVEYQRMTGMVMLPEMAVAAKNEVRSIIVVAKKPIEEVRRLALDTDSRSSVALTRLLCRGLWGISPEFIDAAPDAAAMLAQADAALLIGDPALQLKYKVENLTTWQPENKESCGQPAPAGVEAVSAGRRAAREEASPSSSRVGSTGSSRRCKSFGL